MIRIVEEINLGDFKAWGGAIDTLETIKKYDKINEAMEYIDMLNETSDDMTSTQLNDLLWFENEYLFEAIGLNDIQQILLDNLEGTFENMIEVLYGNDIQDIIEACEYYDNVPLICEVHDHFMEIQGNEY